jgi:prepilin-type processing-associated H-X9-DG protein
MSSQSPKSLSVFFRKRGTVAGPRRDYFYWELHEGRMNGLFLDFSVRKVGLNELWRLK